MKNENHCLSFFILHSFRADFTELEGGAAPITGQRDVLHTHRQGRLAMIDPRKRPGVSFLLVVAALACIAADAPPASSPFADAHELSADVLIEQVLARNPTLTQMVAAAEAAAARYPQVVSLEDPMFAATISPRLFGSHDLDGGYRLELAQKYPWPGKLRLRGQNAAAEARAAGHDVEDTRLQLIESARNAFADYYLAERGLEVNRESLRLLKDFRGNAETRYKTGTVQQQDLLQADVEIGQQRQRQLTLERMRLVALARINTLLHLPPDSPLPPPPGQVPTRGTLPDETVLRALALARRPDLQAMADHIAAERASLRLTHKEYYPDFEAVAAYDDFWSERQLRPQVGVRMNVPIRLAKRDAAVREAEARLGQRIAELNRLTDDVNYAVDQAYQETGESDKTVRLYEQTILPAAEQNVKSAQTSYTTAKIPFISLIEAERSVVGLRDRYYEATADAFRRRAALERAVGGPLPTADAPKP
jgi:outer membrane protein TolC